MGYPQIDRSEGLVRGPPVEMLNRLGFPPEKIWKIFAFQR